MTARGGFGFRFLLAGVKNADSYVIGGTATGAAAGAVSPLMVVRGGKSLDLPVAGPEVFTAEFQDKAQYTFQEEATELPSSDLVMGISDPDFITLVESTKKRAIGQGHGFPVGSSGRSLRDMVLISQRRAKKWLPGNYGGKAWEITVYGAASVSYRDSAEQSRTLPDYNYFVNLSKFDRLPHGLRLTETDDNVTDALKYKMHFDNPIFIDTFLGNASVTAIPLTYEPVNANTIVVVEAETLQVVTADYTYDDGNNEIDMAAATPAATYVHVLYEVEERVLAQ